MSSGLPQLPSEGTEVRPVDVQVQVAPGIPAFAIVGLPDKAVSEDRERVRSALIASGLTLPARCITINLAPADLPKEGTRCGSRRAGPRRQAHDGTKPPPDARG